MIDVQQTAQKVGMDWNALSQIIQKFGPILGNVILSLLNQKDSVPNLVTSNQNEINQNEINSVAKTWAITPQDLTNLLQTAGPLLAQLIMAILKAEGLAASVGG